VSPGTLVALSQQFAESDAGEGIAEEPIDARRYVQALRRHAGLILGAAVAVAVLVLLISLLLPKTYSATAKVAPSVQAAQTAASASQPTQVNLATLQAYVTSPPVLTAAAHTLSGETADSLQKKLSVSGDSGANIVSITAHDGNASRAAQIANTVATTFLQVRTNAERAQFAQQANSLTAQMQAAQAAGSTGLVTALQQQISNVAAQGASAGSDLQLLGPAPVPTSASSPRPIRNALFALIAVLFIGVLAVGARELLAPSVASGRELSALMGLPILGRIPRVTSGPDVQPWVTDQAEAEAYRFLVRSLELAAWQRGPRLVAVTSAARGEGKTTVVTRLGAAIAETGSSALLVSADLRSPDLDGVFSVASDDGLGSALIGKNGHRRVLRLSGIEQVGQNLYVLPSGPTPADPAAILTNELAGSLCDHLRELEFEYVLFDLPALTTAAEAQLFVRHADATILVSMVGVASAEQLTETRGMLHRLSVRPLGIALLGARTGGRRRREEATAQLRRSTAQLRRSTAQLRRPSVPRRSDRQSDPTRGSTEASGSHASASNPPESLLPELDLEPIFPERGVTDSAAPEPTSTAVTKHRQQPTGRRARFRADGSSEAATPAPGAPTPEDPAPPPGSAGSPPPSDQPPRREQPPPR
jgi:capsular exopolysaccharide synthesis family protein